jgi:hypothetical protein
MTCTPEEREAYCRALEERCKHLEATINSAISFLRIIIQDFDIPMIRSLLGPIIERLNSLIAFLETASNDAPALNQYSPVED